MGINLEYMTLLASLKARKLLPTDGNVLEFGAQVISAEPVAFAKQALRCGVEHNLPAISTAPELYRLFGFHDYACIDATGEHDALAYDLNTNLRVAYGFERTFDLVTDLGTFEHCFDIASAFRNAHNACKPGGLMIHALPSNCNANHGYYVIQPRMFADIAAGNGYEIVEFAFTVDYCPKLFKYERSTYQAYDDRDLMVYVVFRKITDNEFQLPFDSIFSDKNTLSEYQKLFTPEAFASYIKGTWASIRPDLLEEVPTDIQASASRRRGWIKRIIDRLGLSQ